MVNETFTLKNAVLRSRIIMPPMATGSTPDGMVTDSLCDYYAQRAANTNVALIITEHAYISPEGMAHSSQVSIASDDCNPGTKKLTDAIHAKGCLAAAQINHAGNVAKNDYTPLDVDTMTKEDINRVIQCFVDAAVRAVKGGYDAVEIHSAHRYLLNQFYSPLTNHRTDEYGPQSIENRTRVHIAVLKAVRKAIGGDALLFIRLGGCDYKEGGSTIEDAAAASVLFEQAGADLIDLSGGMCSYRNPNSSEPGYFKDMSSLVKKSVNIPVLLTGGVETLAQAEALLQEESADLIGVGRPLLKNPDWEL